MKNLLLALLTVVAMSSASAFGAGSASAGPTPSPIFRLHLAKEPTSLDPHLQNASGSSYPIQNLFRNIYRFDNKDGLVPDLGESCKRDSKQILTCRLKKNLKWSDGTALTAQDFLAAYKRILTPEEKAPRADQLFKIKNAEAIYKGQKKLETLGITAPDEKTLKFEFEEPDPEFEYNLANSYLVPIKNRVFQSGAKETLISSGPYKLSAWKAGEKIVLENNSFYDGKNSRPAVEFLFIPEDSVALQLYEKGTLSFLRRLPTLYIPTFKSRPDFVWVEVTRFDYIGFGPALRDLPSLREAMVFSLNYPELQRIFSSEGMPGCPGIPKSWLREELCYKFDLQRAKAALKKSAKPPADLKLVYSVLGGEDHRRATEWLQSQWQKNLNVSVQTMARDNKVFLTELETATPPMFRKGATPDRPTCLAALETFAEKSPENYLKIHDAAYAEALNGLRRPGLSTAQRKAFCSKGVEYLMNNHLLIPTGPIHFAMLAKTSFKGWKINTLNQLDLSGLEAHNK